MMHNPHKGLNPLVNKILSENTDFLTIVYSWWFAEVWIGRLPLIGRFVEYFELTLRVIKNRKKRFILVREFSSYYIWIVLILCFPIRRKLVLLVAHNVQVATNRRFDRLLLRAINFIGVRFASLECDAGVRDVLGVYNSIIIPHPVPQSNFQYKTHATPIRVAVVGDMRPEKGLDKFINPISEIVSILPNAEFIIGTNRIEYVTDKWPVCRVVNTSSYDSYHCFLQTVDVLFLLYPESTYKYRASGVICEAQAQGCVIITSDLPVIRNQVMYPMEGAVCLSANDVDYEALKETIENVIDNYLRLKEGVSINANYRESEKVYQSLISQLGKE